MVMDDRLFEVALLGLGWAVTLRVSESVAPKESVTWRVMV